MDFIKHSYDTPQLIPKEVVYKKCALKSYLAPNHQLSKLEKHKSNIRRTIREYESTSKQIKCL